MYENIWQCLQNLSWFPRCPNPSICLLIQCHFVLTEYVKCMYGQSLSLRPTNCLPSFSHMLTFQRLSVHSLRINNKCIDPFWSSSLCVSSMPRRTTVKCVTESMTIYVQQNTDTEFIYDFCLSWLEVFHPFAIACNFPRNAITVLLALGKHAAERKWNIKKGIDKTIQHTKNRKSNETTSIDGIQLIFAFGMYYFSEKKQQYKLYNNNDLEDNVCDGIWKRKSCWVTKIEIVSKVKTLMGYCDFEKGCFYNETPLLQNELHLMGVSCCYFLYFFFSIFFWQLTFLWIYQPVDLYV